MSESFPERLSALMKRYFPLWEIVGTVGKGSYGNVYKIKRSGSDEVAALKWIAYSEDQAKRDMQARGASEQNIQDYYRLLKNNLEKEISMQEMLDYSDHVVKLHEHYIDTQPDGTFDILMRMELLTPLPTVVPTMTVRDVIRLGKHICTALCACQAQGILHQDIKPENILLDANGHYKLGDFGVATHLYTGHHVSSQRGTPLYMSPEAEQGDDSIDERADLYSLGLVLYELLNAQCLPFIDITDRPVTTDDELAALTARLGGAVLPPPRQGNGRLNDIILKACRFSREDRYRSAQQMLDALNTLDETAETYRPVLERGEIAASRHSQPGEGNPDLTVRAFPRNTLPLRLEADALNASEHPAVEEPILDTSSAPLPPTQDIQHRTNPISERRKKRRKRNRLLLIVGAFVLVLALIVYLMLLGSKRAARFSNLQVSQQADAFTLTWHNGGNGPWDITVTRNGNVMARQTVNGNRKADFLLPPGYVYDFDINGKANTRFTSEELPVCPQNELKIEWLDCASYNVKDNTPLEDYSTQKVKSVSASRQVGETGFKGYLLKCAATLSTPTADLVLYLIADNGGMERITFRLKQVDMGFSQCRIPLNDFILQKALQATSFTCKLYVDGKLIPVYKDIEVRNATRED